jgi:hypothetical protein
MPVVGDVDRCGRCLKKTVVYVGQFSESCATCSLAAQTFLTGHSSSDTRKFSWTIPSWVNIDGRLSATYVDDEGKEIHEAVYLWDLVRLRLLPFACKMLLKS